MKTFPHKIINQFIIFDPHNAIFACVPGTIPPLLSIPKLLHIGGGIFLITKEKNKENNKSVLADLFPIVSLNHTSEPVFHFNVFVAPPAIPINLLLPLIIYNSKSECKFAAYSVIGPDGPIAVSIAQYIGFNLDCTDLPPFSLPRGIVFNNSTVYIGFTLMDFLKALLAYAIEALVAFIFKKIFDKIFKKLFESLKGLMKTQILKLMRKLGLSKGGGLSWTRYRDKITGQFQSTSELIANVFISTLEGKVKEYSGWNDAEKQASDSLKDWIQTCSETLP